MAIYRTDTKSTTLGSIFTWQFITNGGSAARVNRRASRLQANVVRHGELMSISGIEGEPDWAIGPPLCKFVYLMQLIKERTNESTWYSHNRYGNRRWL